jgi:hypothetical protein
MRATAAVYFNATDLYDSAAGVWSTAQLSVARAALVAISVGNVAIFAGGFQDWGLGALLRESLDCDLSVFHSFAFYAAACSLTRATAGTPSNVVDLYNGATGAWSTAKLSLGRWGLAATSVGNVALFAGGLNSSAQFVGGRGGGLW